MTKTNVLVTTYHEAFLSPGGGEVELFELAKRLNEGGVNVDIYGSNSRHISSYDFVLHFSVHGGGIALLENVKKVGKKIILWPNLWWSQEPSEFDIATVRRFFELADVVIFKSIAEFENVQRYTGPFNTKSLVSSWLIDSKFFNYDQNNVFQSIYNLQDYVLWVGVIEPCKNQLNAIRALSELSVPVVFIGAPKDRNYFDQCLQEAPEHFLFIPQMPAASDVLCSAIQNCSTFLELPFDPPGLSALEAGLMARHLVLCDNIWVQQEFGDCVRTVQVDDFAQIRSAVDDSLRANQSGPNKLLSEKIRETYCVPKSLSYLLEVFRSNEFLYSSFNL